jgi:hypothetical protein
MDTVLLARLIVLLVSVAAVDVVTAVVLVLYALE